MKFKNGDRVKGLMYEFKDKIGTVYEQVNKGVILVDFDGFNTRVATMVYNLELLEEENE